MEFTRSDAAPAPPRVGRYQPVSELGSSPLGTLWSAYIATGSEEGRIVQLRRIAVPASDRAHQQRISRAGMAAMSVRHPRIAAVLDVVPSASDVCVVGEYVEGASLRSVLRQAALDRAPLPPPVAVTIASDVARALVAARAAWDELTPADGPLADVVHGGLLPDSILVASFGETMLSELGVAGAAARIPSVRSHPQALPYRAPEQLGSETCDARTDVFTLGVLLWEMLANRPLFGDRDRLRRGVDGDAAALRRQLETAPIPRLDAVERDGAPIPSMVVEIVQEALAREPGRRFPSPRALLDALCTLTRDASASSEQVAVAVNRLVRAELDRRRAELELAIGYDRVSAIPESARSTARPPPPGASRIVVEVPDLGVSRGEVGSFSIQEAPTARRRHNPTVRKAAGRAQPPPPALGRIAAGAAVARPAPPDPSPPPQADAPETPAASGAPDPDASSASPASASGIRALGAARDSLEPGPPSAVHEAPPEPSPRSGRRTALVVAAVAALVALAVIGMMRIPGRSTPAARTDGPEASSAAAANAPATTRSAPPAPEPPEPAPAPVASEPTAPRAPPRTTSAPPPAPEPAGAAPGRPYRPRGI